ncbi:hypothetical protein C0J52_22089 [Blattella germanica]|nr:hypothetical protein C0J52_22089 [Blattella germanica]
MVISYDMLEQFLQDIELAGPDEIRFSHNLRSNVDVRQEQISNLQVDVQKCHLLTDDENIASVNDDQDLCNKEEEPSDEDCAEKGPSSEEAFHCLETAMKWVEQQEECDAVQLLCLKRLRDLAAKKRVSSLKQKQNSGLLFLKCRPILGNTSTEVYDVLSILNSFGLRQAIFQPTRPGRDGSAEDVDTAFPITVIKSGFTGRRNGHTKGEADELQMELITLKNSTPLRMAGMLCLELFRTLPEETYPQLRRYAGRIMALFGTTYVCEQFFSRLNYQKNVRSSITDKHLRCSLRLTCSNIRPNIDEIVERKKCLISRSARQHT